MTKAHQHSVDIEKWLKLIRAECVGPTIFGKFINHFGSVDRALGASVSELAKIDGVGFRTAEKVAATRNQFDTTAELELAEKLGIRLIHFDDKRYPPVLKRIYDPPPVLYIKGSLNRQDNLCISIVGYRRCSLYGREQSSRLAHFSGSAGFTGCLTSGSFSASPQLTATRSKINEQSKTISKAILLSIIPPVTKIFFSPF